MYKIGVIFFAVFAVSQILAAEFPGGVFQTPRNRYLFYDAKASSNESTPFSGRFRFKVKSGNNASISLSTRPPLNDLEFIIGASQNMETLIRVNGTDHVTMLTPNILNDVEFETFEIYWGKNYFHFAQIDEANDDTKNVMLFKSQVVFPVNYIGLKTNGEWFIREGDAPRIFDGYLKTMNKSLVEIGNSLRCMVIETKNHSQPLYVHTQPTPVEQKNYTYVSIPKQSCYNIYVRAKLDAHITLANVTNGIHPVVEFHFRPKGSFNFTYEYNSREIGNVFMKDLLNSEEYRGYWIEFEQSTGELAIGKIGESNFMSRNVEVFSIDYIGVSTSGGMVGDWIIKKNGLCPGSKDDDVNSDNFWGDAKVRCYIENPNNATLNGF